MQNSELQTTMELLSDSDIEIRIRRDQISFHSKKRCFYIYDLAGRRLAASLIEECTKRMMAHSVDRAMEAWDAAEI